MQYTMFKCKFTSKSNLYGNVLLTFRALVAGSGHYSLWPFIACWTRDEQIIVQYFEYVLLTVKHRPALQFLYRKSKPILIFSLFSLFGMTSSLASAFIASDAWNGCIQLSHKAINTQNKNQLPISERTVQKLTNESKSLMTVNLDGVLIKSHIDWCQECWIWVILF